MRSISAHAEVAAAPADVYAFLERLPNHWLLAGRRIEVCSLALDGGVVDLRGPLGLRRRCTIELLERDGSGRIEGRATAGRGTRALVGWEIAPAGAGSLITVRIDVETVTRADRLLLAAGARPWFRRLLRSTLRTLECQAGRGVPARPGPGRATPRAAAAGARSGPS